MRDLFCFELPLLGSNQRQPIYPHFVRLNGKFALLAEREHFASETGKRCESRRRSGASPNGK